MINVLKYALVLFLNWEWLWRKIPQITIRVYPYPTTKGKKPKHLILYSIKNIKSGSILLCVGFWEFWMLPYWDLRKK